MIVQGEFQWTLEEYRKGLRQLNRAVVRRTGLRRNLIGLVVVFVAIMVADSFFTGQSTPAAATSPVAPASSVWVDVLLPLVPWVLIFLFLMVVFRVLRGIPRKSFDETPGLHSVHRVVLNDEGFSIENQFASSRVQWAGFIRFEETPVYLFFYLGPRQAHMVPKRAFVSVDNVNAAVQLAKSRIAAPISAFPVQLVKKS